MLTRYISAYLIKKFHKLSQYFDAGSETAAAYIEALWWVLVLEIHLFQLKSKLCR